MAKTILVITGSPRRGGNSDLLADAFIKGAEQAGNTVLRFDAGKARLHGCVACQMCFKKDTPCAFTDDSFNTLAEYLKKADALVFVTPIYYYNWPSQIKAAIDRMYCFYNGGVQTGIRETALIACAEENSKTAFASLVMNHIQIANVLKIKTCENLLVPGVGAPGEVRATDALLRAEEMGKNF